MKQELSERAKLTLSFLKTYQRDPFLEYLGELLECSPTPEAMQAFAQKFPDRWANMIATFAKLGGYTEKTESVHTHTLKVESLSLSQLLDELKKVEQTLKEIPNTPPTLELTADPSEDRTEDQPEQASPQSEAASEDDHERPTLPA